MEKEKVVNIVKELSKWEEFGQRFKISYTKHEVSEAMKYILKILEKE